MSAPLPILATVLDALRARKLAPMYSWLCSNAPDHSFPIEIWISPTVYHGPCLQYYQPSREDGLYIRVPPQRPPSMVLGLSHPE